MSDEAAPAVEQPVEAPAAEEQQAPAPVADAETAPETVPEAAQPDQGGDSAAPDGAAPDAPAPEAPAAEAPAAEAPAAEAPAAEAPAAEALPAELPAAAETQAPASDGAPAALTPAQQAALIAAKLTEKRKHEGGDEDAPDAKRTTGVYTMLPANASGDTTLTLHAPSDKVGRIIGRGGSTIKELEGRTGTRIQVDHKAEGAKPVHITGPVASVEQCAAMVKDLLESENPTALQGDVNRTVDCPAGIVGRIIGRGGETIRSLQSASGAHITVNQDFPPDVPRQIVITGRHEAVERAYKMVTELVSGDPGSAQQVIQKVLGATGGTSTRIIECPKTVVGRVIGKGGETIKTLQKQFNASIQIDQSVNPCRITIAGPFQSANACERAVIDIIEDRPSSLVSPGPGPRPGGGFGGGGYSQAPPYNAPAYAQPQAAYAPQGGYAGYAPQPVYQPQPVYGAQPGYGAPADPYAQQAPAQQYAQPQYYGQPQYGAPAAVPAAAPAPADVWQELRDEQGRAYYYNSQTGVSQWDRPHDMR